MLGNVIVIFTTLDSFKGRYLLYKHGTILSLWGISPSSFNRIYKKKSILTSKKCILIKTKVNYIYI